MFAAQIRTSTGRSKMAESWSRSTSDLFHLVEDGYVHDIDPSNPNSESHLCLDLEAEAMMGHIGGRFQ